jgi:hypothetical protein
MTKHRIEELADEIAAEVSRNEKGFWIGGVENVEETLKITFYWEPFYLEVTINPHEHESDESVKDEIRRLLSAAGLQLTVANQV